MRKSFLRTVFFILHKISKIPTHVAVGCLFFFHLLFSKLGKEASLFPKQTYLIDNIKLNEKSHRIFIVP